MKCSETFYLLVCFFWVDGIRAPSLPVVGMQKCSWEEQDGA